MHHDNPPPIVAAGVQPSEYAARIRAQGMAGLHCAFVCTGCGLVRSYTSANLNRKAGHIIALPMYRCDGADGCGARAAAGACGRDGGVTIVSLFPPAEPWQARSLRHAVDLNRASAIPSAPPRCGDVVRHEPSGECLTVAYCKPNGEIGAAGWPASILRLDSCTIIARCDDATHRANVEAWRSCGGSDFRAENVERIYRGVKL
jgi:hypothetical protein